MKVDVTGRQSIRWTDRYINKRNMLIDTYIKAVRFPYSPILLLPREIRSITDLGIFKCHLKMHLFKEAFY